MLSFNGSANLQRIVVLNPKGGSGKTTLAFGLAGYLANSGRQVALIDMDSQGSSTHWLHKRPPELAHILGISANASRPSSKDDCCIRIPPEIDVAVVDAPAGLARCELIDYTCGAHAILVPVLPSDLDIHAASRLISELLLVAQVSRRNGRLGVVANRVKERTIAYRQLTRFLERLSITVIGVLRDSQNYTRAAGSGLCIHEMPVSRVAKDMQQWAAVTAWLERCLAAPLVPRDLLRPADDASAKQKRLARPALLSAAAAVAMISVSLWWWFGDAGSHATVPAVVPEVPLVSLLETAADEPPVIAPGDTLRQQWQLSGVALADGASVVILIDRYDHTSRRVSAEIDLDGWLVADAGPDYAVLSQNGETVRFVLNEESASLAR